MLFACKVHQHIGLWRVSWHLLCRCSASPLWRLMVRGPPAVLGKCMHTHGSVVIAGCVALTLVIELKAFDHHATCGCHAIYLHELQRTISLLLLLAGWTYEQSAINTWLQSHDTSPMTNAKMPNKALIANKSMRALIQIIEGLKNM